MHVPHNSTNQRCAPSFAPARLAAPLLALTAGLLTACGGGGGGGATTPIDTPLSTLTLVLPKTSLGPAELAVIVASGDPVSEAIAATYKQARNIPDANIIRVTVPTHSHAMSAAAFATLRASIDAQLPAGVQATLLTWSAPSRVVGSSCAMSITSAMAFGYDAAYCSNTCATTTASRYFNTESSRPAQELGMRPSMMLARSTEAAANALIQRGISADNTQPPGEGWLVRTSDSLRSARYRDFQPLPAQWAGTLALNFVDNSGGTASDTITGKSNVLFYFTGLSTVMPSLTSNSFRPGAIADALTSFAGILPDGNGGQQMPVTQWLDAGATGSYGTVEEPCNFTAKFPQASVLIDQYWRGATLIEAYWKSVATPGQGLFVGEPLAQPFRDAPSFTISGSNYLISSRALRPASRYTLEYRTSTTGSWTSLASFVTGARAQMQNLQAPRPPATATQIRWMGPCPADATQSCALASSS